MSKGSIALLLTLVFLTASYVMTGKPVGVSSEMSSQNYEAPADDIAYSLVVTSDGGFALAGSTSTPSDLPIKPTDFWLVKTDPYGVAEWNQTYGGAGFDVVYSLVETSDGGFALAGYTGSFGAGSTDFWLVKTDSYGNMEWNHTYGGAYGEVAQSLIVTSDGGFALAGHTDSFGAGQDDFWLVKTDMYGNLEWSQTYGGAGFGDYAYSLVETSDGGFALAGFTASFGVEFPDFWLVKTDMYGNMEWNQIYGGAKDDCARSLVAASDGGFALAGDTKSFGAGYADFWLVKTDANGSMEWNQTYGRTGYDVVYSLVAASDGGFALAGYTDPYGAEYEDFWLVKTDVYGNMEWSQTYGGAGFDSVYSLVAASDGGFALAGYTTSFGAGDADFWLVKTDVYGNMEWSQTYGRAMPLPEPTPTESTPPEIKVLSPVNQTYDEPSVSLVFTVNEPFNWTGYSLDGEENVTVIGNVTLTDLSNGLHNVAVYANDTLGNMGVSEIINFTVAVPEQEPESFPVVPVAVASAVVAFAASAGSLVYFKKRHH